VKDRVKGLSVPVANIISPELNPDSAIIEGQLPEPTVFRLATAETAKEVATSGGMEGEECLNFGLTAEFPSMPTSLDDLVDWLEIKDASTTAGAEDVHDIQHFPTFANEDMWPI